jgi:uncharacterized protein (DUF58 family)
MQRARAVVAAGLLLMVAAFVFDAAPLFVPGIGFILIGAITPAWVWAAARSGTVTSRIDAEQIIEHEPVSAILTVRRGRLGLPCAEIQDEMTPTPVQIHAPVTLSRPRPTEIRVQARFERRGRHRLAPPRLRVRDALGLADLVRRGRGPDQELLVLPRTEPVSWRIDPRSRRLVGPDAGAADEPLAAVDVDGLRPYRAGTPASRIHWPALAKGQGLVERQLRADGEARPLIVLDVRDGADGRLLDAAVRATASLTVELARRGGCRLLLPGETRPVVVEPDLRGWPALHIRLAVLTASGAVLPPLAAIAGSAPVFYVALQGPRQPPTGLVSARGGARVLVAPSQVCGSGPSSPTPSFTVSGCNGYVLGSGGRLRSRRTAASAAGVPA